MLTILTSFILQSRRNLSFCALSAHTVESVSLLTSNEGYCNITAIKLTPIVVKQLLVFFQAASVPLFHGVSSLSVDSLNFQQKRQIYANPKDK